MFCRSCGSELIEGAAFCQGCGAKVVVPQETPDGSVAVDASAPAVANGSVIAVSSKTTSRAEAEPPKGGGGYQPGERTLREEVRFAKNLKDPVTEIPESAPTGSELGDELTRFADIYEAYAENLIFLLQTAAVRERLEQVGWKWYYDYSGDALIGASRQINVELADTERALKDSRAQIARNEQARLQASQARNDEIYESQRSADKTAKWSGRKIGCLGLIVAGFVFGLLLTFGASASRFSGGGGVMAGVLCVISIPVVFFAWYVYKNKKKTRAAQNFADSRTRTANARFNQKVAELAQKDAALASQCIQIENRIAELTPMAGEIRNKANERCQFLYSVEMLELGELMQRLAQAAAAQREMLREMGTLQDEDEWFESRRIAKIVASGRADTLKEALQILDTANYREADLKTKGEMVKAQNMGNTILAVGFSQMIENQQQTIETLREGFNDVAHTMEVNHAQEMAMQMKQISQNAKIIKQNAEANNLVREMNQNANGFYQNAQGFHQQAGQFQEDFRDRFNMPNQR